MYDFCLKAKKRSREMEHTFKTLSYVPANQTHGEIFHIHDNGGRPFQAIINPNEIVINTLKDRKYPEEHEYIYNDLVLNIKKYQGYW